ncbi:MAG: arabinofuranosyltransferase [Candidatus Zixiibacteriota bacterium]|nr:MAG: arabinofuranosyltransferase [candidate division Zixibacteria bacterium]
MKRNLLIDPKNLVAVFVLALFLVFGFYLFVRSMPYQDFSEERYIYDLIWLDAWALCFFAVVIVIWLAFRTWRARAFGILGAFSVFGWVAVALFYSGTPFGWNGYGGDQLFRIAMILKFAELGSIGDFYYKNLPAFYPPVYYWLLSVVSRVASFEAYEMMKWGNMAIYLLMPLPTYWLWRRLVSPCQALLASLFTFLFVSFEYPYVHSAPHAFLSNSLFIPWWIHFVEQVRVKKHHWLHYAIGGLIGGLLFMTYFFPFFIGGLLLLIRTVSGRYGRVLAASRDFRWSRAALMLASAAVFSVPFWLPVVWSMSSVGSDAAQQSWHHAGVTGIRLRFMDLSVPGLLFLAAVLYGAKRLHDPVRRGFLQLIGAVVLFLLIGSILGAVDRPVNLIKSREFVALLGGPLVGLSLAALLRWRSGERRSKWWTTALAGVILLIFLNGMIGVAKQQSVKNARTAQVPDWGVSEDTGDRWRGSVVLSGHPALYSFHPVHAFLFGNHHYSNPGAFFSDRFEFLRQLQQVPDVYSFYLALRYNRFDPVEYFMPVKRGEDLNIRVYLSNYPNRYDARDLTYPRALVQDTMLFIPEEGNDLYRLADHTAPRSDNFDFSGFTQHDSLIVLAQARNLGTYMSEAGRTSLLRYFGADFTAWRSLVDESDVAGNEGAIHLSLAESIVIGDSLHLLLEFKSARRTTRNLRVFAHVYPNDTAAVFDNRDFPLRRPSSDWSKGETELHHLVVSLSHRPGRLHLGLFDNQGRLDDGLWLDLTS